ncbi:alpha/beta-hydrolase [Ascodesmis nigricans]|uniref:Alpha/beta-hydrolase n=1 Tax=Ascodesmis nigricans TaxID=341454 RepID=A0A4S2MTZ4_9PEZI|nr:alpha/beta-hydrolase [Ascodesmis nigricans]
MPVLQNLLKLFQPPGTPRILFLHGFTRSGAAFSAQTQALQTQLHATCAPSGDFHFPDGTIPLQPSFADNIEGAYAWWRKCDESGLYIGLDDTLRFLGNYLDLHGPFAGVVGFSQGACLAAILASVLEREDRRMGEFGPGMVTEHGRLGFVVAMSGFRPAASVYDGFYVPRIETPVLSVLGRRDEIVKSERSVELHRACKDVKVLWHERGHVVPRDEETVGRIVEWIKGKLPSEEKKPPGN